MKCQHIFMAKGQKAGKVLMSQNNTSLKQQDDELENSEGRVSGVFNRSSLRLDDDEEDVATQEKEQAAWDRILEEREQALEAEALWYERLERRLYVNQPYDTGSSAEYGHRCGFKPRSRNKDRRREREAWRERVLSV